MPISLTVSSHTASGHDYHDILGKKYTFPKIYRNLVLPGETAVFYTGTRSYPGKEPLSYLGTAIVGEVNQVSENLLTCNFYQYCPFKIEVPFKKNGTYLEISAASNPQHWRRGVRTIGHHELHQILAFHRELTKEDDT